MRQYWAILSARKVRREFSVLSGVDGLPPTRAIMYHVPSERTQWRNKRSFVKTEGMEREINERLRRGLRQKDRKKSQDIYSARGKNRKRGRGSDP